MHKPYFIIQHIEKIRKGIIWMIIFRDRKNIRLIDKMIDYRMKYKEES